MHIAIYFLIQLFRRYIVNRGEIGIQQNLLVADGKDEGFPSGLLFHVFAEGHSDSPLGSCLLSPEPIGVVEILNDEIVAYRYLNHARGWNFLITAWRALFSMWV